MLSVPTISLILETNLVSVAWMAKYAAAQQIQINRDFAPDWGRSGKIVIGKKKGAWPVYFRDHSDVPGALGYHDVFENTPRAFVFVGDDIKYGLNPSVTASHEILETLGDPTANLVRPYPDGAHVAFESCDPCEADSLGYKINGVLLSDFVFDAYFSGKVRPTPGGHPYDFTGALTGPLTIAPGGYLAIERNGVWSQVKAQSEPGVTSRVATSARHIQRVGFSDQLPQ